MLIDECDDDMTIDEDEMDNKDRSFPWMQIQRCMTYCIANCVHMHSSDHRAFTAVGIGKHVELVCTITLSHTSLSASKI